MALALLLLSAYYNGLNALRSSSFQFPQQIAYYFILLGVRVEYYSSTYL